MNEHPDKVFIDLDSHGKPTILHNEATTTMRAYYRSDTIPDTEAKLKAWHWFIDKIPLEDTAIDEYQTIRQILKSDTCTKNNNVSEEYVKEVYQQGYDRGFIDAKIEGTKE